MANVTDPMCAGEERSLCIHSTCVTTDISSEEEGLCNQVQVNGTNTFHCQFPPQKNLGTPCVCFNTAFKPQDGWPDKIDLGSGSGAEFFQHGWWYNYCFCCGVAYHGLNAGGKPLFGSSYKCLMCKGSAKVEENEWPGAKGFEGCKNGTCIDTGGVYSAKVTKCLCCYTHEQCPPPAAAPLCILCKFINSGLFGKPLTKDVFG